MTELRSIYLVRTGLLRLLLFHAVVSSTIIALGYLVPVSLNATSCLLGSVLVGANLLTLMWTWQQIFLKKSIALAAGVIVIKYAILGTIIYWLVSENKVEMLSFLVGLGTLLPTLILVTIDYQNSLKR